MAYRILSFCGGGIRGLLSAGILNRLPQQPFPITSTADLLAGTSTGSDIVSLILANKTPAQIYEFYINEAPNAFNDTNPIQQKPAYDTAKLVETQRFLHPANPPLNSLKRKVLFTAFNVGGAKVPWQPLLLHNLPNSTTGDTLLVDAVVSGCAMPGMFGSYGGNVDGAFVNHDPTLAAIALAVSNGYSLSEIVAICVGTGFMANWIASDTSTWGADQWQNGDGNPMNQTPPLLVNGSISPILNMILNGTSTNLVSQLSAMLLGPRYVYLNPPLDRIIPENDINPVDLAYLEQLAATVDLTDALNLLTNYWY